MRGSPQGKGAAGGCPWALHRARGPRPLRAGGCSRWRFVLPSPAVCLLLLTHLRVRGAARCSSEPASGGSKYNVPAVCWARRVSQCSGAASGGCVHEERRAGAGGRVHQEAQTASFHRCSAPCRHRDRDAALHGQHISQAHPTSLGLPCPSCHPPAAVGAASGSCLEPLHPPALPGPPPPAQPSVPRLSSAFPGSRGVRLWAEPIPRKDYREKQLIRCCLGQN